MNVELIYMVRTSGAYQAGRFSAVISGFDAFCRAVKRNWKVVKPRLTEACGDEVLEVVTLDVAYDGEVECLVDNETCRENAKISTHHRNMYKE